MVNFEDIYFFQEFLSTRSSTSNTNLNSVNFVPNIPILIYQQQESLSMSLVHFDMYPSQVNIIYKRNYKKTPFVPILIKLN